MSDEGGQVGAAAARERQGALRGGPLIWGLGVVVGVAAGYAAIGFRLAIAALQTLLYGADDETIHSLAADLNPLVVIVIPILGGWLVGWTLHHFTEGKRAHGVADVIEAAALRDARVNWREGLASAFASLVTLSAGGSTGREGPVVHLAATISSWAQEKARATGVEARDILGCAAAAAVSASFNAPLAGAIFALEVVLRHYAVHAFGPIVAASVAGAVISRVHMGDVTEYALPIHTVEFYAELPAFALLGLVCGGVAVAMIRAVFLAERIADRTQLRFGLSDTQRPALAGAALGVIAVGFPHVIGVGYETTSRALTVSLDFWTCVLFAIVKCAAVAVTFGGRMGGGVFSPSLMLGALTGAAFGAVATGVFPEASGSIGLYALAGMGAVAAAVLGAPISTTLIVFELTADYQAAIAVMIAVSLATAVAHRFVRKSFFLTQLARAGVNLAEGPRTFAARAMRVRGYMRLRGDDNAASDSACHALIAQGAYLRREDNIAFALSLFDKFRGSFIPVVEESADGSTELVGALYHVDALKALNRIYAATYREEHS
jgi:CIC family chloride channel protein